MGDIEFDETMRWDVIASVPEAPKDKDWLGIVPVKDSQGRIVDWRAKLSIPNQPANAALVIARERLGQEADIRERR
jgi:hypothetical protein